MSPGQNKIEIRRLDASDFDAILGIAEALAEAPHWPRERYEDAVRADAPVPRIALVAREARSGEIAGFTIASLIVPEAELETVAVASERQRQGIGSRLLNALVCELEAAGVQRLHLEVRSSNLPAIHFYESKNFKKTGVRPRYYADPEEDAILMSRHLGES
jgi:ribosomal-protein-alanine N-acetyltransferase